VVADGKGKVAGAEQKTTDAQASKSSDPPSLAYTDHGVINPAAITEELALLQAVYGGTVDTAMMADHDGAACQAAVTKSYEKFGSTRLKPFNGCKKTGLKENTITNGTQLQSCMNGAASVADPKGKVSGARSKLGDTVQGKCQDAGVARATAFPGCSAQAGDPTALTNCVARKVECRMCLMT